MGPKLVAWALRLARAIDEVRIMIGCEDYE
jgi:hypothetical protein